MFTFLARLSRDYTAAFWRFFELSNGGLYMAPGADCTFRVIVAGNGFDAEMSADAAGITACLFAYSHLSFQTSNEAAVRHYHRLRDFALEHSEARNILAAID